MTNELSVEEAIKMLKSKMDGHTDTSYEWAETVRMAIKALERQPNRCDSCIHSEEQNGSNCYECVKGMADNFEAQSIDADCISREAMLKVQAKYAEDIGATRFWQMCDDIRALPSVTPQPKTGHWIAMSEGFTPYKCSECEAVEFKKSKYCPTCGAKMGESEDEG